MLPPPTPPLLFTIGSQDAEALGFQTQKVLPRSLALNAGGAAAKNTKPRGQDEAVRGQANMPRGQANRSGSSKQVQGSRKQGQGSKKQVAQAGEGCCQLGGPCARTRRFSCALVTTALVWQQFRTWMYFGRIKNRVWVRLNVKSKRYA